jgi:hypothetical protein
MGRIDRRRALTLLAGSAPVAGVCPAIPSAARAAPKSDAVPERVESREGWLRHRCKPTP